MNLTQHTKIRRDTMFRVIAFSVLFAVMHLQASQYIDLSRTGVARETPVNAKVLAKAKGAELKKWSVMFHSHGTHKTPAGIAAKKTSSKSFTANGIKFTTSTDLAKHKTPAGAYIYFSARLYTTINLTPDMAGQNLTLRFKSRGKRYDAPTSNHLLTGITFIGSKGKDRSVRPTATNAFTSHSISVLIPQGAKKAVLFIALYGCGELEISEATVTLAAVQRSGADVIVSTSGYTDQQFHIPANAPFPLYMIFKRYLKQPVKTAQIEIELPEGYSVIGSTRAFGLPAKENTGKFRINALGALRRSITDGAFCPWRPQMLLMLSKRPAANEFHEMKYTLIVNGTRQKTRTLKLRTCEFEKSRTPVILGSGLQYPYGHDLDQRSAELMADTYLKCGFNIWADKSSKEMSSLMKSRGIRRISSPYQLRNGYHIQGNPGLKGDDCFLDIYGKPYPRHICPVSVYKKSAYFRGPVMQMIEKAVGPQGSLDEILTNWEPYYLDYKGCFCSRCAAEFAKYAKVPFETIKQEWPQKIIAKYGKTWINFRSWQHGLVIKTVAEAIREAGLKDGGKKAYFVPEISHYGFAPFMADRFTAQYHARDYLKYIEKICIWGPYTFKGGIKTRYLYTPGHHMGYFLTTRNVDQFVKKYSTKTRIHALPHGSHCGWVSTPEAVVFDTLCSFVHNAIQSTPYWFYYDYRYHREMARMNSLIAEYEKEFTSWPRNNSIGIVPTSPLISARHWKGAFAGTSTANMFPEIFKEKAVQALRWSKGGKNLFAVANIWEKDGVFVKVSFPDIQKGKWIVRSEFPKTYRVCSADELQKGIELHIPALTWKFFRLLPFDRKLCTGEQMTAASVSQLKAKLLPGLKKSFEFEENLLKSRTDDFPDYDFGALPEIRSANVSVSGTRLNGAQAVLIKTPAFTAVLDPEKGGRLQSFKVKGKEILAASAESGMGLPGCWMPFRKIIPRKVHLVSITPVKEGVTVELHHPADSKTAFEWKIVYIFNAKGFRETFTVVNTGKKSFRFMGRFHHMLKEPSRSNPVSFIMGGKKVKLPLESSVARTGAANEYTDAPFNVRNFWQGADQITFPGSGVTFKARGLYGHYFWNSPGAVSASFEPTFQPVTVEPGKAASITQEWQVL